MIKEKFSKEKMVGRNNGYVHTKGERPQHELVNEWLEEHGYITEDQAYFKFDIPALGSVISRVRREYGKKVRIVSEDRYSNPFTPGDNKLRTYYWEGFEG